MRSCTRRWLNCSLHCIRVATAALPLQAVHTVKRGESRPARGPAVARPPSSLSAAERADVAASELAACSFRRPEMVPGEHAVPQHQPEGCTNALEAGRGSEIPLDPCNRGNPHTFGSSGL